MSRTAFTEKFGVALPIVGAPMDGVSYCELAAAVARAGGLGMIACAVSIPADEIAKYDTLGCSGLAQELTGA